MNKSAWRKQILAERRARVRPSGTAFSHHARQLAADSTSTGIAAYYPSAKEPDLRAFVEDLDSVFIPRLFSVDGAPLPVGNWGIHTRGEDWEQPRRGAPKQPRQAAALGDLGLLLVPALAVDRSGTRLGRGGGWYDRILASVDPHVPIYAVVHSWEFLPAHSLPQESHDRLVHGVVTEEGIVTL